MLKLENQGSLKEFLKQKIELTAVSWFVFLSGEIMDEFLEKECRKYNFSFQEFTSLIKPPSETLLMKYYREISNTKDLEKFVEENKWIGYTSFYHKGLNIETAQSDLNDFKNRKEQNIQDKCPDELKKLLDIANKLAFYRTYCKEAGMKVGYSHLGKLKEFAKKNNLSLEDLENMPITEILEVLSGGSLSNLKGRSEESGTGFIDEEYFILPLDKTKEILEVIIPKDDLGDLKIIKGSIASKGIARGVAKLVLSFKDLDKVKEGDILVAVETIPEFLSAMRRAAAFVTDQGGVTCHAAIVSREFGVPCIVGTRFATQKIKDGDLVEVDADNGIVRIIKE